jgi:flagellar hook-associated protein 2
MSSVSSTSSSSSLSSADWSALIEGAVAAKLAAKTAIETRVTKNETKIEAYETLQSLLADISDAAYTLSAPSGYLAQSEDVFNSRAAYLTASGGVTASDVLGVAVDSGTDLGTYNIKIDQVATAHKIASGTYSSSSTACGADGVFTIGLEGATAASITVTSTMTLADIASAINATTSTSKVKATVLKVSDTSYQLVLTGTDTGKSILTTTTSGTALSGLGIADASNNPLHELQAVKDAIFSVDGVQLTRDSNTVSDAIDGVTFYLYAATTSGASVNVEVSADYTTIQEKIQALVDAYNAYRDFVVAQQATATDGTAAETAVLFGNSTLRATNTAVMNALNTAIGDSNMALLGLSFDASNYLELDTTTLQDSLLSNIDEIKSLLAFSFSSTLSTDTLRVLSRGTSAPTSFNMTIQTDAGGSITGVLVDGVDVTGTQLTISGTSIKGVAGTQFDGFTFVYLGTTTVSTDITLSYGLAEKLNQAVTKASEDSVQADIDNLTDRNTDYQSDISKIETRAETLRTTLTTRYANYQAKIAKAESTLTYLKAMLDAANSD